MNDKYTIVHYGELRLKGRNRIKFENKLINNIKKICGGKVEKLSSSVLCKNSDLEKFRYVSGISWYAQCIKLDKDFDSLLNYINNIDKSVFNNHKSFAIRVKRSDKSYKYNSNQIATLIGDIIRTKFHLRVDLKNPDITIYIEINEYILVYYHRYKGLGGFPNGIHGKVLCLLSGGIDSPVAAYLMMRKGCHVDLIHFHGFTDNNKIKLSKIDRIIKKLIRYQLNTRLFVVPSYLFDLNVFDNKNTLYYEMILFRRFIYILSQKVAMKNNYKILVSGDSLGQVASQTIENLVAVTNGIKTPIVQPLIAFDKQEIIDVSREIDLYDLSIEPYKDCCSIKSRNPVTRTETSSINRICKHINLDSIVSDSLKLMGYFDYR